MPVAMLRQVLSDEEFHGWVAYLNHEGPDVTEMQLAQIAHIISQGLGAKNAKYEDYLIRKPKKFTTKKEAATPNGLLSKNEVQSVFAGIAVPMGG